jgi:hypothetical protein
MRHTFERGDEEHTRDTGIRFLSIKVREATGY